MPNTAPATAERWRRHHAEPERWFWKRVAKGSADECWPWLGYVIKERRGYGRLAFKGKLIGAHRMALILSSGEDKPGQFACHRCDNPPCCNPSHLFWGTPKDNVHDSLAKGRQRGAARKIDISELLRMRGTGRSYSQLAAHFQVNQASIGRALKRALRSRATQKPSVSEIAGRVQLEKE